MGETSELEGIFAREGSQIGLFSHLLKERMDPAVVALHEAEALQVAEGARHHARDGGDSLEVDEAIEPPGRGKRLRVVVRGNFIKECAHGGDEAERDVVANLQ